MSEIRVVEGVRELPRDAWNRLVGDESPFLEWEWLASLEEAGCVGEESGWIPRPIVVYRGDELIAACPVYIKLHSEGEFVYDWAWADAAQRAGISYYPKLLVGVPFSPVTGARFLVAPGEDRAALASKLAEFLRGLCAPNKLSGVHVNFCHASELELLCETGYLPRIGFQYHWSNEGYRSFDEYLDRFRSKRRNQIRRERRELKEQEVEIHFAEGDQIDDGLIEDGFRFYLSTIEDRYWGRQYLNRKFFQLLRERFRDRLLLILARQGNVNIAGTVNVKKGDALYGRYWGADRTLRFLHFNVCYYAPVEYCIEHRIARFEPGAGGEYKHLRGFDAQPTYSGHYFEEPRLASAIADYLERERKDAHHTIAYFRERSSLKLRTIDSS